MKGKSRVNRGIIKTLIFTSILSLFPPLRSGANIQNDSSIEQQLSYLKSEISEENSLLKQLEPKIKEYVYQKKLDEIGYTSQVRESIENSLKTDDLYKQITKQFSISKDQYMMLKYASKKLGVPLETSVAVMVQESSCNPNAISTVGCLGDMQLNIGTAIVYDIPVYFSKDLELENFELYRRDLEQRLTGKSETEKYFIDGRATLIGTFGGVKLIKELAERYDWDPVKMYLDYNGGPNQVLNPSRNALEYVNNIRLRENFLRSL